MLIGFHQQGFSCLIDYRSCSRSEASFVAGLSGYGNCHWIIWIKQHQPDQIFIYGHSLGIAANCVI